MKNINNKISRNLQFFILGLCIPLFTHCDKNVEVFTSDELQINTDYPDLRFANIVEEYHFSASSAKVDSFEVKSLYHKWEIKGNAEDPWYNINPSTGDAGMLYKVGISTNTNTDLDDRLDTLTLISADWEGKTFVIFQKGSAFLQTVVNDSILAEDIGDQLSFYIESNQNWSASIAEDIDWMAIEGASAGNGIGTITLKSIKENGSLRRSGIINLYDRNDVLVDWVTIYQNGIFLEFATTPEQFPLAGGNAEIAVNSNTAWNVIIPEGAESWLSVDETGGNKNETLNFTIAENSGEVRSTYVMVESNSGLIKDSLLISQNGAILITEEFFAASANSINNVTFNSDGSATLTAPPGSGSKNLVSKRDDFSYGKYTINFSNYQMAITNSTMLVSICPPNELRGGVAWGSFAKPTFSDGWASVYWLTNGFGSQKNKRFDTDLPRDGIEKFIIDVKRSATAGIVDVDFYVNDQLLKSVQGTDGFAAGDPMILSFWIYNFYDKVNPAIFEPSSLIYEPYK